MVAGCKRELRRRAGTPFGLDSLSLSLCLLHKALDPRSPHASAEPMPKRKPPPDASASSGSAKRSRQSNTPPSDDYSQLSLVQLQKIKNRVAKMESMLAQVEERAAALQPLLRLKRAEARVEELEGRLEESKSACRKAAKRRRTLQCVEVSIALLSSSRVCAGLP
jgi:hypothetical protein